MTEQDLSELSSLEELRLADNNLQEFPAFLLSKPALRKLIFCGAGFTEEDYLRIGEQAKLTNPVLNLELCRQ
jgi:hypothetical protein